MKIKSLALVALSAFSVTACTASTDDGKIYHAHCTNSGGQTTFDETVRRVQTLGSQNVVNLTRMDNTKVSQIGGTCVITPVARTAP